jgi:endo-1,4-beta-xylanase
VVPSTQPPVMQIPPEETPPPALPEPTNLRGAADRTGRVVGVALQARLLNDASYTSVAREFSSVTAENEMKWQSLEPQPNQFNFNQADRIVAFAEQNEMRVRGHTLVWHSQLPGWVSQLTTPEAVRSAMLNHIETVVSRYRGRVFAWDVVNEAWQDNASALRTSVFQQQLGDRFIDEAFIAARAADPDAKLYYNDYGTEGTNRKANAVFTMVQGMVERGVPIDGVGMQMHIGTGGGPTAEQFASNMQRLVELGLEVNISELDISACGDGAVDERLQAQAERAYEIVQACMNQPACNFITVWGISDQYSWRRNDCEGQALPLLFDASYQKKPAYAGVFDALLGR